MFKDMSDRELQAFINSSHASREYDSYFDDACRERNDRENRKCADAWQEVELIKQHIGRAR